MAHPRGLSAAVAIAAAVLVFHDRVVEACGCLSPPAVSDGAYAVNQRAEQIIFETEPGWVTAHVLIKYAGAPDKFAWIIPVPEVPELALSPTSAFGLLDKATAPNVGADLEDLCPVSEWACQYHAPLTCGRDYAEPVSGADGAADAGAGGAPGEVTVIAEKVVGDYQTVTFRASEAAAATRWLRDNGFVVNPAISIYMEPYVQQNMVFIAAKLVAGARVSAIKPLRLRYRAAFPMIPLVLTAVAAEPHLTVTAYVLGAKPFRPMGHPVVTIDSKRLAQDAKGRGNYPMVLARAIDEAGGDGFAIEYRGAPPIPALGASPCCGGGYDRCRLASNQRCECPRDEFDRVDCAAQGDLADGLALVDALAERHRVLTRITTRLSPEQMTFDPTFEIDYGAPAATGALKVRGSQASLQQCAARVIDQDELHEIDALQACAAAYCGIGGQCTVTAQGAGCACPAGAVAQAFVDLDGQASTTCVPRVPVVDLRASGVVLPSACTGVDCGLGQCVDRNGVAACDCDGGAAAVAGLDGQPRCVAIDAVTHSPGADDYSEPLRELAVCAPPPPTCGVDGWLVRRASPRPGVDCGNTQPAAPLTREPPQRSCDGWFGCGSCQQGPSGGPVGAFALWLATFAIVGRRRHRRVQAPR